MWAVAILDPWCGLEPPGAPGATPGIQQGAGKGSVSEGMQAHHAATPPTREAIVSGVRPQERDGGAGNTCHHPGDTRPIAAPGPGNR